MSLKVQTTLPITPQIEIGPLKNSPRLHLDKWIAKLISSLVLSCTVWYITAIISLKSFSS